MSAKIGGKFDFVCYDGKKPYGHIKWKDTAKNCVTNEFMNASMDILANRSVSSTSYWYVGLMSSIGGVTSGVTPTDTLASHASWTECNAYNNQRKVYTTAAAAGNQVTNSANKAQFVMSGSSTIWGGFVCGVALKNSTTGTLMCAAGFSGSSRSVASGDTVEVTYAVAMADDNND